MSPTANTWLCSFLSSPPGSHLLGVSATLHWPLLELCALSFGQSLDRDSFLCFLLSRAKAVQNFHKSFRKGQLKPKKRRNLKYMQRLAHKLQFSSFICAGVYPGITEQVLFYTLSEMFSDQFSHSVLSLTLCDPMDCSTPGLPVHHRLSEFAQAHVHRVGDAIQPSHPLLPPSPAFNLSQHQGIFQWVSSSHQVAKVLEFQLQHQSFQWIFRTDFL